jgi:hypothetical protein
MRAETDQRAVKRYLNDLERALSDVSPGRRGELLADVRAHIELSRADEPDVPVEQVLERLGSPADVAEEATDRLGPVRRRPVALDYLAVGLLLIGGLVLPAVGWFLGLALLLSSPSWTRADKALGALVVPGGLAPAVFSLVAPAFVVACSRVTDAAGRTVSTCPGGPSPVVQVLLWLLFAFLVIGPIATSVRLLRRLR